MGIGNAQDTTARTSSARLPELRRRKGQRPDSLDQLRQEFIRTLERKKVVASLEFHEFLSRCLDLLKICMRGFDRRHEVVRAFEEKQRNRKIGAERLQIALNH